MFNKFGFLTNEPRHLFVKVSNSENGLSSQSEIVPAAVMASRDIHGSGTPESQISAEPVQQSERLESSRDEGLIPDRIEEPLMSFAENLGQNFGEEQQAEDTSIIENMQDVLGDRGVPLGQLIDDKQDIVEAGMEVFPLHCKLVCSVRLFRSKIPVSFTLSE